MAKALRISCLVGGLLLFGNMAGAQFRQQGSKLVAADALSRAMLGAAVSISAAGDTAIVGGPAEQNSEGTGAAWIFTRSGEIWSEQAKLLGTGALGIAGQGTSVALSADGNTAISGGPFDDGASGDVGAAWIFVRNGTTWTQQDKLIGTGTIGGAGQGYSVALSADGNTAIVGGWVDNDFVGAAWVFVRNGTVWSQQAKLVGTGGVGQSEQGLSAALSADGNTALVGGPGDHKSVGAVWVFTRTVGVWEQQGSKLVGMGRIGSNPAQQGLSVALSADSNTALVGGPGDNSAAGAAWVFTRRGSTWTQQGNKITGGGAGPNGRQELLGASVSLSGDGSTALVGGPGDNSYAGAAWVFQHTRGAWRQVLRKLVGTRAAGPAWQGSSVCMSANGKTAIVGGPMDNQIRYEVGTGAAWIFALLVHCAVNSHVIA
jgi:hypothetical protein